MNGMGTVASVFGDPAPQAPAPLPQGLRHRRERRLGRSALARRRSDQENEEVMAEAGAIRLQGPAAGAKMRPSRRAPLPIERQGVRLRYLPGFRHLQVSLSPRSRIRLLFSLSS